MAAPQSPHPGRWWTPIEDDRIQCNLCPRHCRVREGQRAFCFVRKNEGGQMVLTTYGRSSGFCIDPIEKKPLNHFLPGTAVLSFGTAGCNLGCKFCQNWDISKSKEMDRLMDPASPELIAAAAEYLGCRSVAFTYNDPVIFAEYAIDIAKECRKKGIHTVAVTAGYITDEARGEFYEYIDAANVDLKAFSQQFYEKITFSNLEPVLDTLRYLKHETDIWFEITTLLIPTLNDSDDELRQLSNWIADELGSDVPLHFSAFHPDFKMNDLPRTPARTLTRARKIATDAGLNHVYTGNVHDTTGGSTYCSGCGTMLIERDWYVLGRWRIENGVCKKCKVAVPGRFEDGPGTWGAQRQSVNLSSLASELGF